MSSETARRQDRRPRIHKEATCVFTLGSQNATPMAGHVPPPAGNARAVYFPPPGALTHSCKHLPSWAKGGEGARLPRVLRGRCLFYGRCELWHGNGDERRDHGLRDWGLTARCQVVLVAGESSGRLPCPWCCQQGAKS